MDKLKKGLEAARREKAMALRRVHSLEVECQDLQAALEEADSGNNEADENDLADVANKVARLMRVERDNSGKALLGEEAWAERLEYEAGWQDFLCGNHSRNLPVDAFNRR